MRNGQNVGFLLKHKSNDDKESMRGIARMMKARKGKASSKPRDKVICEARAFFNPAIVAASWLGLDPRCLLAFFFSLLPPLALGLNPQAWRVWLSRSSGLSGVWIELALSGRANKIMGKMFFPSQWESRFAYQS